MVTRKTILVGTTRGLYALDPTTGAKRWRIASDKTLFPPAVSDSVVYVGGRDGSLRAVALDTGRTIWRRDFGGWIYTPAIVDGRLVAGGNENILRGIDARNGDQLWQKTLEQEVVYRPVAVPGSGVVITTFGAKIVMVNANNGATRWEVRDTTPSFPPAIHAGRLYFGTFGGSLKARPQEDGHVIWAQQLNGRLHLMPYVADGVVLVGSDQGELAAYEARTGKRLWHDTQSRELVASPLILNGAVIGFTSDTEYFSLRAAFLSGSTQKDSAVGELHQ